MARVQAWESDEAIEEDMPDSPGAEKQDKEKDQRESKKNRGEASRSHPSVNRTAYPHDASVVL